MIGAILCALAFGATYASTRRRLVSGVVSVVATGYLYGIVRAWFLDGASHFIFDSALIGLYAAHFSRRPNEEERIRGGRASVWVKALFVMPAVMVVLPLQHPLIQVVGLRASVLFLPMVLVGSRLRAEDLLILGRAVAFLNLVAFAFATGEWVFGIEPFFPYNSVTQIIYSSIDVGAGGAHRIPATFANAHAYAGTMLASLPLLAGAWEHREGTSLASRTAVLSALVAALVGIFASGARTPVLLLFVLAAAVFLDPRVPARARLGLVVLGAALGVLIVRTERFQRFTTVSDVSMVESRIQGSNLALGDVILSYPLGAGLGRATGTSIPYFLAHLAEPQIGLENEFSRLIVDQGLLGAGLWVLFVAWVVRRRAPVIGSGWALPYRMMRLQVALAALTGLIGTGLLLSIPQSPLLLLQMGLLSATIPRLVASSPAVAWQHHWGKAA